MIVGFNGLIYILDALEFNYTQDYGNKQYLAKLHVPLTDLIEPCHLYTRDIDVEYGQLLLF